MKLWKWFVRCPMLFLLLFGWLGLTAFTWSEGKMPQKLDQQLIENPIFTALLEPEVPDTVLDDLDHSLYEDDSEREETVMAQVSGDSDTSKDVKYSSHGKEEDAQSVKINGDTNDSTPFLTCGAKLPVMALFGAIFFGENAGDVVFAMYLIGIIGAILASSILSRTVFEKDNTSFVLELPPYRIPDMKTVLLETWDKGKGYLIKAGTIIFAMSVILWFLSSYNFAGQVEDMSESLLASLGGIMSTLFVFHGFDTWEAGSAVITGIMAKEAVISTMGILYGKADGTVARHGGNN